MTTTQIFSSKALALYRGKHNAQMPQGIGDILCARLYEEQLAQTPNCNCMKMSSLNFLSMSEGEREASQMSINYRFFLVMHGVFLFNGFSYQYSKIWRFYTKMHF